MVIQGAHPRDHAKEGLAMAINELDTQKRVRTVSCFLGDAGAKAIGRTDKRTDCASDKVRATFGKGRRRIADDRRPFEQRIPIDELIEPAEIAAAKGLLETHAPLAALSLRGLVRRHFGRSLARHDILSREPLARPERRYAADQQTNQKREVKSS